MEGTRGGRVRQEGGYATGILRDRGLSHGAEDQGFPQHDTGIHEWLGFLFF